MASYVFARMCDKHHRTRELALQDLVGLVRDEYYYTRNESPPKIMRRTPMIGIGAHGGRGLFLSGHCAGLVWEELPEDSWPYRQRIDVIWEGAVYRADYDGVMRDEWRNEVQRGRGHQQRRRTSLWCSREF